MTISISEGITTNDDVGMYDIDIILTDKNADLEKIYAIQLMIEEGQP